MASQHSTLAGSQSFPDGATVLDKIESICTQILDDVNHERNTLVPIQSRRSTSSRTKNLRNGWPSRSEHVAWKFSESPSSPEPLDLG